MHILLPKFKQKDLFTEKLCPKGVDGMASGVVLDKTSMSSLTRQDKIYFESARHITVNVSSRELLNRLIRVCTVC